jgi:glycosyltransferase involved in cell wall biosynthesis
LLRILQTLAPTADLLVAVESEGEFVDRARAIGCEVIVRDMGVLRRRHMNPIGLARCGYQTLSAAKSLARLIEQRETDIVFTSTLSVLAGALAARWTGREHIWFVQEILLGRSRWLRPLISRLSSTVIAVSRASAESTGCDAVVAYPGIDADGFEGVSCANLRARYSIPEKRVLMALVGRIHYWKGQDYFLDALAELKRRGIDEFYALIVGDVYAGYEELRRTLHAKCAGLGLAEHVRFTGHIPDVKAVMAAADIVIAPSTLPDPFCLVVAEGMASARPVVSTRWGGPAEMIEDDISGFLVAPDDAKAFAGILERLMHDPGLRHRIGEAARSRIATAFSAKAFDQQIRSIVEQALLRRSEGRV